MLDLDSTEAVELGLVAIGNKAKRIEEAKRRLGTKLRLEGLDRGGLGGLLSRGESGGGSDEGGGNDGLHVWSSCRNMRNVSLVYFFEKAACTTSCAPRLHKSLQSQRKSISPKDTHLNRDCDECRSRAGDS